jgi:hypothetical protein
MVIDTRGFSMRIFQSILSSICLIALPFAAGFTDITTGQKSNDHVLTRPAVDGREGGEDILTAWLIPSLPFADTGATCDNLDDYDEACPYIGSDSPDVVYAWMPSYDGAYSVDLWGSTYDTKVYIYDAAMNVIACNDDYYDDYTSLIDIAEFCSGDTYFIVIDGYSGDCGEYVLHIDEFSLPPPVTLVCPPGAILEGEPALVDGYVDNFNGGCDSDPPTFQALIPPPGHFYLDFCGKSGWYDDGGTGRWDTDWYDVTAMGYEITWSVDVEQVSECMVVSMSDCSDVSVVQTMMVVPYCAETMVIATTPGELVHLLIKPSNPYPPPCFDDHEYDYVFSVDGLANPVATDATSWSTLKLLYR